jgi:hypothetical protein
MLDPRKVRGLLKTIKDFDGFSSVTVSDGETTVSVVRGEAAETVPGQPQPRPRKQPPKRSALASLSELPPVGVFTDG